MIKILLSTLILCACSAFIPTETKQIEHHTQLREDIYCKKESRFELFGLSQPAQNIFINTLREKSDSYNFRDEEITILWLLHQLSSRPDLVGPHARLTTLVKYEGNLKYIDIKNKQGSYIEGIYLIGKFLKLSISKVKALAKLYDQYFKKKVPVDQKVHKFLSQHNVTITRNEDLSKFYMRGDEVLRPGESLPHFYLSRLFSKYKFQNTTVKQELFNYPDPMIKISCNYDMKLYESSIFLISPKEQNAHLFALKTPGVVMLASSAQEIDQLELDEIRPFFKATAGHSAPAACTFAGQDIFTWAMASQSRDPGQHLFHLIKYGMSQASQPEDIVRLLNFSRHIFLSNPLRLIYESQRGSKEQLDELLKMNVPVYNADSLGNIWIYQSIKQRDHFFIDPRINEKFSCK